MSRPHWQSEAALEDEVYDIILKRMDEVAATEVGLRAELEKKDAEIDALKDRVAELEREQR